MSENYLGIMRIILSPHNYGYRILSPSIYDDAEKLRFIGILAYPKILCNYKIIFRKTNNYLSNYLKRNKVMTI